MRRSLSNIAFLLSLICFIGLFYFALMWFILRAMPGALIVVILMVVGGPLFFAIGMSLRNGRR